MKQIVSNNGNKRKSMMEESNLPLTVSVRFYVQYCSQHNIFKAKMTNRYLGKTKKSKKDLNVWNVIQNLFLDIMTFCVICNESLES